MAEYVAEGCADESRRPVTEVLHARVRFAHTPQFDSPVDRIAQDKNTANAEDVNERTERDIPEYYSGRFYMSLLFPPVRDGLAASRFLMRIQVQSKPVHLGL